MQKTPTVSPQAVSPQTVSPQATSTQEKRAASVPSGEELVTVRLFKDNERYRDDVYVAVNGRSFQIKRGADVQVPRFVKEVLDHSQLQDTRAAEMMDALEQKYVARARKARG